MKSKILLAAILITAAPLASADFWWESAAPGAKPQTPAVPSVIPTPVPIIPTAPAAPLVTTSVPTTTVVSGTTVSGWAIDGKIYVKDAPITRIDTQRGLVIAHHGQLQFELPVPR